MKLKWLLIIPVLFLINEADAQIRLPRLVRDSMVLQRDIPVNIWGWASPGEKIRVSFNGKTARTTADGKGDWIIKLPSLKAGGPFTMELHGKNDLVLKDVLVGDVWLCTGQSNMVHQMGIHNVLYEEDIAKANYPQIRQFWVPTVANMQGEQSDLNSGNWSWANPKDILQFSAIAYFFARDLYQKYKVPIGIINASYGGTPIEAWISENGLKPFDAATTTIKKNRDTAFLNSLNRRPAGGGEPRPVRASDKGTSGPVSWFDPAYQPKGWRRINIPGYWEDQGIRDLDGVVWYRREIDVPASMTTGQAKVFLGRIVDADALYINGKQVGTTGYLYPQRRYPVPQGLLKQGKNLFVIRVQNNAGKGGFVPDKPYSLISGKDTVDLKGTWEYKVGEVYTPVRGFGGGGGGGIAMQNQPAALYNSMVAPYNKYTIKGIAWYQGESNTGNAVEYARLLPALISDWRSIWKQGDLPFVTIQLPGFGDMTYQPSESQWAMLREAQFKSLSLPNTALVVTTDLGEWNDIHPDRKKEVGERLALATEKLAYKENDIVYSGPLYESATVEGSSIRIKFTQTGSGLVSRDGEPLTLFSIAGADKRWVWAEAKIDGNTVVVRNAAVAQPMYVRFAWADNPDGANLFNKEGLPASPFRTDK